MKKELSDILKYVVKDLLKKSKEKDQKPTPYKPIISAKKDPETAPYQKEVEEAEIKKIENLTKELKEKLADSRKK